MPLVRLSGAVVGRRLGYDIYDDLGRLLLKRGIELTSVYVHSLWERGFRTVRITDDVAPDIFEKSVLEHEIRAQLTGAFRIIASRIERGHSVDRRHVRECVTTIMGDLAQHDGAIMNLVSINTLDNYTFEHSINACVLSVFLHSQISDRMDQRMLLGESALLHDVGKLAVPPNILLKPGSLTEEEYDLVKNHTVAGETIAASILSDDGLSVVRSHHEQPDGCGYPDSLKAGDIGLLSQIVAIADVYDAVTSDRVYREGLRPHQAVELLHAVAGTQLDAPLVHVFTGAIAHYPEGSILRLSSGELAVVAKQSHALADRPMVRMVVDPEGRILSQPADLHLADHPQIVIEDVLEDWPTPVREQVVG